MTNPATDTAGRLVIDVSGLLVLATVEGGAKPALVAECVFRHCA